MSAINYSWAHHSDTNGRFEIIRDTRTDQNLKSHPHTGQRNNLKNDIGFLFQCTHISKLKYPVELLLLPSESQRVIMKLPR
jgi:hypothetical protein